MMHLTQLICAYRLWNEDLEIVDLHLGKTGSSEITLFLLETTSMSAVLNPGGYVVDPQSLEQFEISDERSVARLRILLRRKATNRFGRIGTEANDCRF
jgi:2-iminoacetate synthase